ncbi:hypothetical protein EW145_g1804 [Phellinidium pouzarii]|uniref:Uncharacterized protein n=1 Tax=Phellinidium pouzarii TaxID=167371 RepID=A0A4V3XDH4_9AGAM|nr:hypothetical protein EW145_g1804 [Phellinidium pouzarii]
MLATPPVSTHTPGRGRLSATAVAAMSDGNLSDTGSIGYFSGVEGLSASTGNIRAHKHVPQTQKFPHTRAQLANIARDHRFRELAGAASANDSDADVDDYGRWGDEQEAHVSSALVRQVASLLSEENEDELKELLKKTFEMDSESSEAPVLELMHAHKDDISGVPFLFLTPTRRPISRPSSRASNHSFRLAPGPPRPDTPLSTVSAPSSPSLLGPIRRPHTPAMSPLATGHSSMSYMTVSPSSSPTFAHVSATFATSLPASPLSSPRLLNAKAHEFRPTPRPLSAASSIPGTSSSFTGRRAETPSPDLWAHGPGSLRGTSKLAIASPLIPDNSLLPPGTPPRAHTPTSPLRISSHVAGDEEDEDDPFDPFSQTAKPHTSHYVHPVTTGEFELSNSNSSLSEESGSALWGGAYPHPSASYPDMFGEFDAGGDPMYGPAPHYPEQQQAQGQMGPNNVDFDAEYDPDTAAALTDGMTPFDVLSSVFGATLAPSELEEALAVNGYDFERAMQWLVDRARPSSSSPNAQRMQGQGYGYGGGAGVHVVPRAQAGVRGGRTGFGGVAPNARGSGRYGNGNGTGRPTQGGNRVCRYFLAGECMRADCRFSHDLDRALCRFWLRGTCAKGESCEFLHHLPNEVDVQGHSSTSPPQDEFPTLSHDNARRGFTPYSDRGGSRGFHDAGRTRFAAAVKKPAPFAGAPPAGALAAQMAGRREAKAVLGDSVFSRPTVVAPQSVSSLYMAYRGRALQLGAARNACLSRAADAWRRGDGAAAKRFSREGHDLNARMGAEAAEAAVKLVRERARVADAAVRARDASWSSDPADRSSRGKACGGGLGVCLGVASKETSDETAKLTQEERTEAALDLHGLHSNEATEVLEEFLLSLEKENFFGLAYIIVGEEKHTGTQDAARGASRIVALLARGRATLVNCVALSLHSLTSHNSSMSAQHSPLDCFNDSDGDLAQRFQQHATLTGRPSSIDMALNLERQLVAEHEDHEYEHERGHQVDMLDNWGQQEEQGTRPVSLDPLVLSGIVANLRTELARVARERDALADALAAAPSREAELREALALITERSVALESELEYFRKKSQDDEDAIQMLRNKVEESRRGLMRLQTESKRMSQMSIDTSRANTFFGTTPMSSKRASFTPLTGSGAPRINSHRRISSVSEPSFITGTVGDDINLDTNSLLLSPPTRAISLSDDASSVAGDAKKVRRTSGFFGASRMASASSASSSPSPPPHARHLAPELSINTDSSTIAQLEELRRERDAMRVELAAARGGDVRGAGGTRGIRASGGDAQLGSGVSGILKLPPLPTDKNLDENAQKAQKAKQGAGWSFGKLWRADTGNFGSAGSRAAAANASEANTSTETTSIVITTSSATASPSTPATALSRKLGGFFSARASSITSIASIGSGAGASTRPATAHHQQEPTLNGLGSDDEENASADDGPLEPVSPAHELSVEQASIMVRDATSVSTSSTGSELGMGDTAPLKRAVQVASVSAVAPATADA